MREDSNSIENLKTEVEAEGPLQQVNSFKLLPTTSEFVQEDQEEEQNIALPWSTIHRIRKKQLICSNTRWQDVINYYL